MPHHDRSPCRTCPKKLESSNKRCRQRCSAIIRYLKELEQDNLMSSSLGGRSYSVVITD